MITLQQARDAMAALISERGRDFVYGGAYAGHVSCFYVPLSREDAQSVSHRSDVDIEDGGTRYFLAEDNRTETACAVGEIIGSIHPALQTRIGMSTTGASSILVGEATEAARQYLDMLQQFQDSGRAWGEAFDHAEAWVIREGVDDSWVFAGRGQRAS